MNFERTSRCDCELLTLTKYVYHQFYERVVFLSEWDFCTIHFLWWAVHVSIIWKIINGPPGPSAIYQLTEYHRSLDLVHLTRLGIKDSSGLSSTEGWSRAAYMMTSISGAIYNINSSSNPLTMRIIYIYIYPLSLSLSILSLYPFSQSFLSTLSLYLPLLFLSSVPPLSLSPSLSVSPRDGRQPKLLEAHLQLCRNNKFYVHIFSCINVFLYSNVFALLFITLVFLSHCSDCMIVFKLSIN